MIVLTVLELQLLKTISNHDPRMEVAYNNLERTARPQKNGRVHVRSTQFIAYLQTLNTYIETIEAKLCN